MGEIIFAIVIAVLGLVLFGLLIGNMQVSYTVSQVHGSANLKKKKKTKRENKKKREFLTNDYYLKWKKKGGGLTVNLCEGRNKFYMAH